MTAKASISSVGLESRQFKPDSAIYPAEPAAALPHTAADKDLVWRYWRAAWLSNNSNSRR